MFGLEVFERIVVDNGTIASRRRSIGPVTGNVGDLLGFELIDPPTALSSPTPVIGDAAVCPSGPGVVHLRLASDAG